MNYLLITFNHGTLSKNMGINLIRCYVQIIWFSTTHVNLLDFTYDNFFGIGFRAVTVTSKEIVLLFQ